MQQDCVITYTQTQHPVTSARVHWLDEVTDSTHTEEKVGSEPTRKSGL